jgi:1,2-diacylglycerol 3-beta-galactosyltransferase
MLIERFTPNVEYFMALADFFIGKPGPGSISEALQLHLPVIVESNSRTLPQERYNAQWVTESHFGVVVDSFTDIAASVQGLLESRNFDELRRHVGAYSNRALFEVPVILDQCVGRSGSSSDASHQKCNTIPVEMRTSFCLSLKNRVWSASS